jgi:hypothetical protein
MIAHGFALISCLGLAAPPAPPASAQGGATHVLLVTGLSGEPRFARAFDSAAALVYDAAKGRWGAADSSLFYLGEDPARDPGRIQARATRESIAARFALLARRAAPGDLVFVLLVGHGSGEGAQSRFNLPGPDVTAADFAGWLRALDGRTVVLVNASSASGDFLAPLSGPGRVVVTATKSAMQRNETTFAGHFSRALTSEAADGDKDGRISLLEAFTWARAEVARGYERRNLLATEQAQLTDSALARTVAFGTAAAPTDPHVAALWAERRALEGQVDVLRRRKGMLDSTAYARELERLLLEIATRTAAIRAAGAPKP